jgi:hypothetical protein
VSTTGSVEVDTSVPLNTRTERRRSCAGPRDTDAARTTFL